MRLQILDLGFPRRQHKGTVDILKMNYLERTLYIDRHFT